MRNSNSWEQLSREKKDQFHSLKNYTDKLICWLDNNIDGISYLRLKDESKSETEPGNLITEATIFPANDQEASL